MGALINKHKFFAILRNLPNEHLDATIDAIYAGGIRLFEVTFNLIDPDTERQVTRTIHRIYDKFGDTVECVAGTVVKPEYVRVAREAGATGVVAPNTDIRVGEAAHESGMLWYPGASTPTEIVSAYNMGADIVKIFPILPNEMDRLRVILPPLAGIPFMPTGGVNANTVRPFMELGAAALSAGASIVTPAALKAKDYAQITANAKAHVDAMADFL